MKEVFGNNNKNAYNICRCRGKEHIEDSIVKIEDSKTFQRNNKEYNRKIDAHKIKNSHGEITTLFTVLPLSLKIFTQRVKFNILTSSLLSFLTAQCFVLQRI